MSEIRAATRADNRRLLALTRATPMPGAIGLRIDRDPDFFRLLSLRGEGTVRVSEADDAIRGCISFSRRTVLAAGEERTLWYVGDMKVHPEFRNHGVGAALAVEGLGYLREEGADLLACVVARGNRRVLAFLEGRFQIPSFRSLGPLDVFLVPSARRGGSGRDRFLVREARDDDVPGLTALYEESSRRFELAPTLAEEDWRGAIRADPEVCGVLVAEEAGRMKAAGWLFDVQWAKQHVVTSLPRVLSLLAAPLRPLAGLSSALRIPRAGQTVAFLCLRHLAVRGEDPAPLRALVREARKQAHVRGFPFVMYGMHERDPFRRAFRRMPRFTMGSELFLTSLQGNGELLDRVARGVPVEDYAIT